MRVLEAHRLWLREQTGLLAAVNQLVMSQKAKRAAGEQITKDTASDEDETEGEYSGINLLNSLRPSLSVFWESSVDQIKLFISPVS